MQNAASIYFVAADTPRAAQVEELVKIAQTTGAKKAHSCSSIEEGMQQAFCEAVQKNQLLVVCGSFFIMHKARRFLGFNEPYDSMDLNEQIRIPN